MKTKRQQRILNAIIDADSIVRESPKSSTISRVFAGEWSALNDALTVEQSYQIQDEFNTVETIAERLMIVRNWQGRLDTAASKSETTIFNLARQAVEDRKDCFQDETVIIYEDNCFKVRVWRSSGRILMDAVNGDPRKAQRVQIGHLTREGWQFTLDRSSYRQWVKRVHRLI